MYQVSIKTFSHNPEIKDTRLPSQYKNILLNEFGSKRALLAAKCADNDDEWNINRTPSHREWQECWKGKLFHGWSGKA